MQENQGKSFGKSYWQGGNVYKCAKNIRKMKWYPIIRILLYLRDIESKEKNYEESIKWHEMVRWPKFRYTMLNNIFKMHILKQKVAILEWN